MRNAMIATAMTLALMGGAHAQQATTAGAQSVTTVNSYGAIGGGSGGGSTSGHLYTTPSLGVSEIVGANPCLSGVGGGAGGGPATFMLSIGYEGTKCGKRATIASLIFLARETHNDALAFAAVNLACTIDDDTHTAMNSVGIACPGDKGFVAAPQAAAVAQPVLVPVAMVQPAPAAPKAAYVQPEWCFNLGKGDPQHKDVCHS